MASKKMRRTDPRIRQTLNQISHNLESANIATQASLFSFSETYLSPCLASFRSCLEASCQPCFAARDDLHPRKPHHHRNARRTRDHFAFEFYDDWNEEAGEWGNDELDRLLARSGGDHQPGRHGSMSYGSRIIRRKSLGIPKDGNNDPTVVPSSSIFGFLERLPWKFGRRGRRYRPSAADLDENVGRGATRSEGDRLLDEAGSGGVVDQGAGGAGRAGRNRSATTGSQSTSNSYSSRGDLFPSEDEADAVPIDDEFAMLLARRNTGTTTHTTNTTHTTTTADDLSHHSISIHGGPPATQSKRPAGGGGVAGSHVSAKTTTTNSSSKASKNSKPSKTKNPSLRTSPSTASMPELSAAATAATAAPEGDEEEEDEEEEDDEAASQLSSPESISMSELKLKQEEEHIRNEEEAEIERKRIAARKLARQRGLSFSLTRSHNNKEDNKSNDPRDRDPEENFDSQFDEFQEQEPKPVLSPEPEPQPSAHPDPPPLPPAQAQPPPPSSDSLDHPPDPTIPAAEHNDHQHRPPSNPDAKSSSTS